MKFALLASGSKGNASLIYTDETLIQVDMGVSLKCVKSGVKSIGHEIEDISALFITHDHSDHIKGVRLYRGRLPIYCAEGTLRRSKSVHYLTIGEPKVFNDITVTPFSTSHDARNPIGFLFSDKKSKLAYVTDTGLLPEEAEALLHDCDYYIFESNHDLKMLYESDRPISLKRRIHSEVGHLSNVDSANYLASLIGPHTKQIYLCHLSEECNTEPLALKTIKRVFNKKEIDIEKIKISAARQWESVYGGEE